MAGREPVKPKSRRISESRERSGSLLGKFRKPSFALGKRRAPSAEDIDETSAEVCESCRSVPLPAHKAAYLGHIACLTALGRDAPGKMTAVDRNGATPMHLAARQMNVEAVT